MINIKVPDKSGDVIWPGHTVKAGGQSGRDGDEREKIEYYKDLLGEFCDRPDAWGQV